MFLELALVLPLYILVSYALVCYQHVIKAMTSLDSFLPLLTDEEFDDVVDTPEEGVAQRKKREILKDAIQYGKTHFLPRKKEKWSTKNIDRKTDEEVEKLYNIYMQQQTQVKGEMTGRVMGTHMIILYSAGISKVLKIDNKEQILQNIDGDLIIKDPMAHTGAAMISTFGKWLPLILITCHTANYMKGFVIAKTTEEEGKELKE